MGGTIKSYPDYPVILLEIHWFLVTAFRVMGWGNNLNVT